MARKLKSDPVLFIATMLLVGLSVVMVYSASAVIALEEKHSQFHYVIKQGIWTLLGFVVMFIAMRPTTDTNWPRTSTRAEFESFRS